MCDLILLNGISTSSWYAEFAFRRRVSMSAMGSVIVMSWPWASLAAVSCLLRPSPPAQDRGRVWCGDLRRSESVLIPGRDYQELLVTPGSSPRCAISRRHTRHRPNLRYTECGRPQRWQRVYARTANLGLRAALAIRAFFAISVTPP